MTHPKPIFPPASTALGAGAAAVPRKASAGPYHVSVYDGAALPLLDWPGAADDAVLDGFVYQSREFLAVWFDTLGKARRARSILAVVADERGPALWLPLVVEREFGCAVLRFPDGGMADYNAPVLRRSVGEALDMGAIWRALAGLLPPFDLVDFTKMPATVWQQPNPMLRLGPTTQLDAGYYLPIEGTHAEYLAHPSRKGRVRKLGQLFRKLARSGAVTIGEVRDAATVAAARRFIEEHKALQYRRTLGFSQFDQPGVQAFLDRLVTPAALDGFTRLTALTLDGAVIGAQLDFVTARRQNGFMTTFDAGRHSFISPGRQVQLHLIERAFADGRAVFDLGHGDNAFKFPWMTHSLPLHSFARARTFRGALFLAARTLRRRVPAGLGARLRSVIRPVRAPAGAPEGGDPES